MSQKSLISYTIATLATLILLTGYNFYQSLGFEDWTIPFLITILSIAAFTYHFMYVIRKRRELHNMSFTQGTLQHFPNQLYLSFIVYFLLFLEVIFNISTLVNYRELITIGNILFLTLKSISVLVIIYLSYKLLGIFNGYVYKQPSFDFIHFFALVILSLVCIPILESFSLSISFLTLLFIHLAIVYIPFICIEWIRYRNVMYVLTLMISAVLILPLSYDLIRSNSSSINFTLISFVLLSAVLNIAIIYFFIVFRKKGLQT